MHLFSHITYHSSHPSSLRSATVINVSLSLTSPNTSSTSSYNNANTIFHKTTDGLSLFYIYIYLTKVHALRGRIYYQVNRMLRNVFMCAWGETNRTYVGSDGASSSSDSSHIRSEYAHWSPQINQLICIIRWRLEWSGWCGGRQLRLIYI